MHLLVFGGTGPSGVVLIREALQVIPSCMIVVYARNPSKLPEELSAHTSVTVVQGELDESDKLSDALVGIDAVLTALGPPTNGSHSADLPLTRFYAKFIPLMRTHGVKRLIALGTASIVDSHDKFSLTFWFLTLVVSTFYNAQYRDLVEMGKVIAAADDIEWTIVRVPMLNDGPNKKYVAGYVGDGKTGFSLARAAFGAFMIEELLDPKWPRTTMAISSSK